MTLSYQIENDIDPGEVAEIFRKSGLRRPVDDIGRMTQMVQHANLMICARDGQRLVGLVRGLTDFSYCCYLSCLAVDRNYRGKGIGKELIRQVKEALGEEVMILLLSLPRAHSYYPHIGFEKAENAWLIDRKR